MDMMAAGPGGTNAALNLSLTSASYMPQAALLATNSTQQHSHSPNSHQQAPPTVVDYASSPMHQQQQGKTDVKVEVEEEGCGIKQQQQTKTRKVPKRYEKLEGYIRAPRGKVPNEEWLAKANKIAQQGYFPVTCGSLSGLFMLAEFGSGGKGKAIKLPTGERLSLTEMEMRGRNFDKTRDTYKNIRFEGYSIMHLVNAGLIKRHHKNSCFCRVCTDGQQEEPILWEWQPAPPKKKHKQQHNQQQESWRRAKKKPKLLTTVEQQQQQHHIPQQLVQLQQMQQMPQQQQLQMQPPQFLQQQPQQQQQQHHYPQQQATIVKTETVVKTEIETVVDSVFSKVVKGVDGSHGCQSQVGPQQQLQQAQQGTALLAGAPFIYHPSPTYGIYSQTQAILDQANYHPTQPQAAAAVYQPFFIAAAQQPTPQGPPHGQFAMANGHLQLQQQQPSKPHQQQQQTSFATINDPRFL